jgi:hypothetical protein
MAGKNIVKKKEEGFPGRENIIYSLGPPVPRRRLLHKAGAAAVLA